MAQCDSKKITELAILTSASIAPEDLLAVADVSIKQTKSITLSELESRLNAELYVQNAVHSDVSDHALNADFAASASWSNISAFSFTSSYAQTIAAQSLPISVSHALYADVAGFADYASEAGHALTADNTMSSASVSLFAESASWASSSVSSSYALTSSYTIGTPTVSASYATTASYAVTASYFIGSTTGTQFQKVVATADHNITSWLSGNGPGFGSGTWILDPTISIPITANQRILIDFVAPYYARGGDDIAFYIGIAGTSTCGLICTLDRDSGGSPHFKYFTSMSNLAQVNYIFNNFGATQDPGMIVARGWYLTPGVVAPGAKISFYYTKRANGSGGTNAVVRAGRTLIYSVV
jgi:hypothetical protein